MQNSDDRPVRITVGLSPNLWLRARRVMVDMRLRSLSELGELAIGEYVAREESRVRIGGKETKAQTG